MMDSGGEGGLGVNIEFKKHTPHIFDDIRDAMHFLTTTNAKLVNDGFIYGTGPYVIFTKDSNDEEGESV